MITDVKYRLNRTPSIPFVIRTSDGHEYSVPKADHAFVTPRGNRVVVIADNGATNVLGPLHINAIVDQQTDGAE